MSETHANNEVNVSLAEVEPPSWLDRCERFCLRALDLLEIRHWEVSILFCSDRFIRKLNHKYRGQDRPTDVLSFDQREESEGYRPEGGTFPAGDIVISLEAMKRNAAEDGIPEEEELKRLLLHGILHLYGMDHPEADGASEMIELQEHMIADLKEDRIF